MCTYIPTPQRTSNRSTLTSDLCLYGFEGLILLGIVVNVVLGRGVAILKHKFKGAFGFMAPSGIFIFTTILACMRSTIVRRSSNSIPIFRRLGALLVCILERHSSFGRWSTGHFGTFVRPHVWIFCCIENT